jgi:hypothetical protein
MRRSRPGRIASAAALVELVLVAITGNQAVSDFLVRDHLATSRAPRDVQYTVTAFAWRLSAQQGLTSIWTAELVGIGVLVVLTFLFVLAIGRGQATFGRVFFGTWFAVVAAASFAVMVRALIASSERDPQVQGANRIALAVFESNAGFTSVFALLTGVVAGLGAATTAAMSARPAAAVGGAVSPYPAGAYPPAFFDHAASVAHPASAGSQTPYPGQPTYGQPAYGQPTYGQPTYGQPTYEQPTYEQPTYEQPTYEQPVYGQPTAILPEPGAGGGQPTAILPEAGTGGGQPTAILPEPEAAPEVGSERSTAILSEPYVGGERPTAVLPELPPERGAHRADQRDK